MKLAFAALAMLLLSSCTTVTYTNANVSPAYYGYSYPSTYTVGYYGYRPWYYRTGYVYTGRPFNYYRNYYGGRVYGSYRSGYRGIYRSSYYRSTRVYRGGRRF